ncbi:MAG: PAS domain S-box protein [Gemmatimonadaceae bacterium]|nr:PAS domain S-box protein [Gemmatimonadaceae bacterium]
MEIAAGGTTPAAARTGSSSEARTLERIPGGCLVVDGGWKVISLNEAGASLLGHAAGDIVGRNLWQAVADTGFAAFFRHCHAAMHDQADVRAEAFCAGFWLAAEMRPWRDGVAIFFRDAGPEHRMAARALAQVAEIEQLMENASEMVHVQDAGGRVTYANRAWRETLGYHANEAAELTFLDLVVPEDREAAAAAIVLAGGASTGASTRWTLVAKDGRRVSTSGRARAQLEDGSVVSTRASYCDLSDAVACETLLLHAQHADAAAARAKGTFLDRLSHEWRTPLAAVIGFAGQLERNAGGRLSTSDVGFATRIGVQGRHLLGLVDDVLAYANVEAHRTAADEASIELGTLVQQVVAEYRARPESAGSMIMAELGTGPAQAQGDPAALRRILRCLLDDALARGSTRRITAALLRDDVTGVVRGITLHDEPLAPEAPAGDGPVPSGRTGLALGITVARSVCQLSGYAFHVEFGAAHSTTNRIVLRTSDRSDGTEQDDMATTLHAFLAASPLPIVSFTPDWQVRTWNGAAQQMFGWAAVDAVGRRLPFLRDEDDEPFRRMLREVLASSAGIAGRPSVQADRDGRVVDAQVSLSSLRTASGRLRGFIAIFADVSEQTALQARLRNTHKMDAISTLAGGIAHDFNNIISVISAHAEFLIEALEPGDQRHEDACTIRDASTSAADLTRQILQFASPQTSDRRLVNLNDSVADIARMLGTTLGSHIEFAIVTSPVPVLVDADPGALEQMIMNLVLNARDALADGGALIVETSLGGLAGARWAGLAVSDTGCGMTPTLRARIFEPFFTTKPAGRGMGLGLSGVETLVRGLGGSIVVESESGAGSAVRIKLPEARADTTVLADATPVAASTLHGDETILLVEDQEAVRLVAARMLGAYGYTVLLARHGGDALSLLAQHDDAVDLVVADLIMPEMNGAALAQHVHARWQTMPVLFMSGYTDAGRASEAAAHTASPVLRKPFTSTELVLAVRTALDGARGRR